MDPLLSSSMRRALFICEKLPSQLCFLSVLCVFNKFIDHGGRRGDTAHALAQWLHPVASSEALEVLHRAMCPASYRHIRMAIKIVSNLPAFLEVV